jgi:hypothetical protein
MITLTINQIEANLDILQEIFERFNDSVVLLKSANAVLPVELYMDDDFRGAHHLIIDRQGRLCLNVWCNGRLYSIYKIMKNT